MQQRVEKIKEGKRSCREEGRRLLEIGNEKKREEFVL